MLMSFSVTNVKLNEVSHDDMIAVAAANFFSQAHFFVNRFENSN